MNAIGAIGESIVAAPANDSDRSPLIAADTADWHLACAAGAASGAQRMLLAAVLHVEAAEEIEPGLDGLVAGVRLLDVDVASVLEALGDVASGLQGVADDYSRRRVAQAMQDPR